MKISSCLGTLQVMGDVLMKVLVVDLLLLVFVLAALVNLHRGACSLW